jgi:hypothetical protein
MADGSSSSSKSLMRLVTAPTLITLGITILRLVGELQHWPAPWFNTSMGGGGAIIGISWLPLIFGPYFAFKLAGTGEGPSSAGKAIILALAGLVVLIAGGVMVGVGETHPGALTILGFVVMLAAAFIPGRGWPALGGALLAYAFAARIPVLVVMFFALRGNGGQGWGTHYDALPARYAQATFATKFFNEAVLPQMCLWIGYTVIVGALFGTIAVAIAHRSKVASRAES